MQQERRNPPQIHCDPEVFQELLNQLHEYAKNLQQIPIIMQAIKGLNDEFERVNKIVVYGNGDKSLVSKMVRTEAELEELRKKLDTIERAKEVTDDRTAKIARRSNIIMIIAVAIQVLPFLLFALGLLTHVIKLG